MKSLTQKQQWLIGGLLLLLMLLTRGNIVNHLQDASWAVFFLVGFYLRSYLAFPAFWLAAFVIDLGAIYIQGVDNYCFTPSYPFLIPAYALLWLAGRWFAAHCTFNLAGALRFSLAIILGVSGSFIVSNFGFFVFSEHFNQMTALQYINEVGKYLPMYLQTTGLYLLIAATIHSALRLSTQNASTSTQS